jgi:SpoU rRNA methylase family enzyme
MQDHISLLTRFECLPIDIYRSIHSYLSYYDYRQFMNSNKATFYPIKYETVVYNLSGIHKWIDKRIGIFAFPAIMAYFQSIIMNNVKNRQQQVIIAHSKMNSNIRLEDWHLAFQGIHSISISFEARDDSLSNEQLHYFSDISHISLVHVEFLTSLSGLNGNIISLEINDAPCLVDISQISHISTLETVVFINCNELVDISSLKDIPYVTIYNCPSIPDISVIGGNHKSVIYSDYRDGLVPSFLGRNCRAFLQVEKLEINGNLSTCDFSFLAEEKENTENRMNRNLRYLKLSNTALPLSVLPFQPSLSELDLSFFDLSAWRKQEEIETQTIPKARIRLSSCMLPNSCNLFELFPEGIIHCSLSSIQDMKLLYFPVINLIEFLQIDSCHDLLHIMSGNQITDLSVSGCTSLEAIYGLGNCHTLTISECDNFHQLTGIQKMNKLRIQDCDRFIDLSHFTFSSFHDHNEIKEIKEIHLIRCSGFSSLHGIINVFKHSKIFIKSCKRVTSIDDLLFDAEVLEKETAVLIDRSEIATKELKHHDKPEIHFLTFNKQFYHGLIRSKDKLTKLQEYVTLIVKGIHLKDASDLFKLHSDDAEEDVDEEKEQSDMDVDDE